MKNRKEKPRYAENAAGPFYVEKDLCIACRNPEQVAPDLIGFVESSTQTTSHCYFKRQPETPEELERAIQAVATNCCGSYRYAGNDSSVRTRLNELGCDYATEE
jgi:ferredoxin